MANKNIKSVCNKIILEKLNTLENIANRYRRSLINKKLGYKIINYLSGYDENETDKPVEGKSDLFNRGNLPIEDYEFFLRNSPREIIKNIKSNKMISDSDYYIAF